MQSYLYKPFSFCLCLPKAHRCFLLSCFCWDGFNGKLKLLNCDITLYLNKDSQSVLIGLLVSVNSEKDSLLLFCVCVWWRWCNSSCWPVVIHPTFQCFPWRNTVILKNWTLPQLNVLVTARTLKSELFTSRVGNARTSACFLLQAQKRWSQSSVSDCVTHRCGRTYCNYYQKHINDSI